MNTQTLIGRAIERMCGDPFLWDSYWEQRKLDGPTIQALLRRITSGSFQVDATYEVVFSIGFEAGRLASDPVSHMDEEPPRPTNSLAHHLGAGSSGQSGRSLHWFTPLPAPQTDICSYCGARRGHEIHYDNAG